MQKQKITDTTNPIYTLDPSSGGTKTVYAYIDESAFGSAPKINVYDYIRGGILDYKKKSAIASIGEKDSNTGLYPISIDCSNVFGRTIGINVYSTDNDDYYQSELKTTVTIPSEGLTTLSLPSDRTDRASREKPFGNNGTWFKFTPGELEYCTLTINHTTAFYNLTDKEKESILKDVRIMLFNSDGTCRCVAYEGGGLAFDTQEGEDYYAYVYSSSSNSSNYFTVELSKYDKCTATLSYDTNECTVTYSDRVINNATVNGGTITNIGRSQNGTTETDTLTLFCNYYYQHAQMIPMTITPASGYKCNGFTDNNNGEDGANYGLNYAHHFNILKNDGTPLYEDDGKTIANFDNGYGTQLPSDNFYCCTEIYDSTYTDSDTYTGWSDIDYMVEACKDQGCIAIWKDSEVEWEPRMGYGDNYSIDIVKDTSAPTSKDAIISGLDPSYGKFISEKVNASEAQKQAVKNYLGKDIAQLYELKTENGNQNNLGNIVTVKIPCDDPENYDVVWLKTDSSGSINPVPMIARAGNNCLEFDTAHFSSYALVKNASSTPTPTPAIGGGGGGAATLAGPTIITEPTIDNSGNAVSKVDTAKGDKIVQEAIDSKADKITVDAKSGNSNVGDSKLNVPGEVIKNMAKNTDAGLEVKTDLGTVNVDNKALDTIAKSAGAGDVEISIKQIASSDTELDVEVTITSGGKKISGLGGGSATITLTPNSNLAGKTLMAVFKDDKGNISKVPFVKNSDGSYTLNTPHLSTYALMEQAAAEKQMAKQDKATIAKAKVSAKAKAYSGKIKVSWKALTLNSKVKYQVFRATKSTGKYSKIATVSKASFTNSKLVKGKTYYYKVKAVSTISGKTYCSKTSKVVSATVK